MLNLSFRIMLICVAWVVGVAAQTVDEILQKYLAAMGGYEALKSIQTIRITARLIQGGMEMPCMIIRKRPDKSWMKITYQGKTMIRAYDGERAWMRNPFSGGPDEQLLPRQEALEMARDSDMDGPLVDYQEKGHRVELLGKEKISGKDCFKLKLILQDGSIQYYYLDDDEFLVRRVRFTIKRGLNSLTVDRYLKNYVEMAGVRFPQTIESKVGGRMMKKLQIKKIAVNIAVADSIFSLTDH